VEVVGPVESGTYSTWMVQVGKGRKTDRFDHCRIQYIFYWIAQVKKMKKTDRFDGYGIHCIFY
jgi:hypothetical protein